MIRGEFWTDGETDVALGRAILFPVTQAKEIVGLQISRIGVVEEKKLQVIHHLTLGGEMAVHNDKGIRQPGVTRETEGRSVNADTDWQHVPGRRLARVMTYIITWIVRLRVKSGARKRTLLQTMDVKSAFLRVGVTPDWAAAFAYYLENIIIV